MTQYLLDTHVLLWALAEPKRIKPKVRALLEDMDNQLVVSVASLWEIAIKSSIGKMKDLPEEVIPLLREHYTLLNISYKDILCIRHLPMIHRDPFDRMLVAQAQQNKLPIITRDKQISAYNVKVIVA
jgi:PIN domain nuclease of toxin-antitoxin system